MIMYDVCIMDDYDAYGMYVWMMDDYDAKLVEEPTFVSGRCQPPSMGGVVQTTGSQSL